MHDRPVAAPLYDPRFEHDACGVGFVADGGGRSSDRVLPLALAGLAALAHRGAFGADGESSDGAGVSMPLDASVLELIAGDDAVDRPAIAMLFLPRGRSATAASRDLVERVFADAGLPVRAWRTVPFDAGALGAAAAASRPLVMQAIVARPPRAPGDSRPLRDDAFERRLVVARRRLESAARDAGGRIAELSVPSASCLTVVYKGLVTGARLDELYADLRAPVRVGYTVFHQRYATNTHPVWRLAQPFRSIAHNGEINTVRGNREQVRGRAADRGGRPIAADLLAAGPLLSPDGSDSLSLDEGLELLTTTGWDLAPALLAAIPEALALRGAPHPSVAALRRRTAGFLAPWDGPAAIVFADGRRVGALVDRNGLRPAAFAVTADRLVAVASEAGAVPFAAADTIRRGRLGPGEMLLVEPGRAHPRGQRREGVGPAPPPDPRCRPSGPRRRAGQRRRGHRTAGPARSRRSLSRRPRRRAGPARYQDDGPRWPRAAVEHGRRHADGRPRSPRSTGRGPPPPGLRPGHQPGHRSRARADRHGPAGRARPATLPARRPAARPQDAPPRTTDRGRPRRAGRRADRGRSPDSRPRRHVAGHGRRVRPGGRARCPRRGRGPGRAVGRGRRRRQRRCVVDRSPAGPVAARRGRDPYRPDRRRPARPDRRRRRRRRHPRRAHAGHGHRRRGDRRPSASGARARDGARRDRAAPRT